MRYFISTILLLALLSVCAASAQESSEAARRITPAEARQAVKRGKAIIVDVRSEDVYQTGHIKGARSIPLGEILTRIKELPRDKMIITYDSSPIEHTSARAVMDLDAQGIKNAAALVGGYNAWVKAGYPTQKQ